MFRTHHILKLVGILRAAAPGLLAVTVLAPALVSAPSSPAFAVESAFVIPAPAIDQPPQGKTETAILAGGCFWGVQGVFQHVKGVTSAVSGYSGGSAETAKYETIGSGRTGHAEAVKITFDPQQITYGRILQIYFSVAHDPTELNRQGPDTGTQYRSAVFPTDADQARVAGAYIDQLNKAKVYPKTIATKIEPLKAFYPAEDYHQDFLTRNPSYPYIVINDLPKIDNLKMMFKDAYRQAPVLVAGSKS
ncbi:peptide-methionine (S)-S-oxide reductase MsrA [Microvirga antarctica]|uniref:peptide-methionine (S)-S-oxide reductase MsrA n=1 Tax=Microvirga antarctica TaxID=2819233 RepID=UPI001B308540|nr:peptide-methionine (S)-S-oxide reductase MsrA [Microvirga antarctica]